MMIERVVVLMMSVGLCVSMSHGGISDTGDVDPADPTTWTNWTSAYIGKTGVGGVTVDAGSDVSTRVCYLGYDPGSAGAVTVSGAGSTLTSASYLRLGWYGEGTLAITDGALVEVAYDTHLAWGPGSAGSIHFDNGTLTTRGFVGAVADLSGIGTINCNGLASDVDLLFDATHGLAQTLVLNGSGRDITVNLNVSGLGQMGAGYGGNGSMHISDGLVVGSLEGYIGYRPGATGTVTVSGAGSAWDCNTLYVGSYGDGALAITNGGIVRNYGYARIGYEAGSTGAVTVSGDGSRMGNSHHLYVGTKGDGTLNIADGASVSNFDGNIGAETGSTGLVTVSGAGSQWTSTGELKIGGHGQGTMEITNGGAVDNQRECFIGDGSGSTGTVKVSGAGSDWFCKDTLYVGREGNGTLDVFDDGDVRSLGGSIGGTVTIRGAGSTWTSIKSGYQGGIGIVGNGVLNITGGGAVIGNKTSQINGSAGTVTVSGAGSTWTTTGSLYIADSGNGTLNISDGGLVVVTEETFVARKSGASGSIHFDNGVLTTAGFLGSPTDLYGEGAINAAGLISDVDLVFDAARGLTQTVMLTGPGQNISVNLDVDGSGSMGAGYRGNGSTHISDGLAVESTHGYIGYQPGSTGVITVSGPGSTWINTRYRPQQDANIIPHGVTVGYYGHGTLEITNGGLVRGTTAYIGEKFGSTGVVMVSGAGSAWLNSEDLYAGRSGDCVLKITNGGTVSSQNGYVVGAVTVSDAGSRWANSHKLYVGSYRTATLEIANGGAVSDATGYLGNDSNSTGAMTVRGAESKWTNYGDLYVGVKGRGVLNITDGGLVSNVKGFVGDWSNSTGAVIVSGDGSKWTNSSDLYVGKSGNSTLDITNGGTVSDSRGYVGHTSAGIGAVTVRDPGSTWINFGELKIGYKGIGTLDIANGGLARAAGGMTIDYYGTGNSYVSMATGGMLALAGDADDSLGDFLGLINGSDDIRFWDDSISDWADITGATPGEDYTLAYMSEGDLDGYTVLTVPEPATMIVMAFGALALLRKGRKK